MRSICLSDGMKKSDLVIDCELADNRYVKRLSSTTGSRRVVCGGNDLGMRYEIQTVSQHNDSIEITSNVSALEWFYQSHVDWHLVEVFNSMDYL